MFNLRDSYARYLGHPGLVFSPCLTIPNLQDAESVGRSPKVLRQHTADDLKDAVEGVLPVRVLKPHSSVVHHLVCSQFLHKAPSY